MKRIILLISVFISFGSFSQNDTILSAFDFWVGDWEAHWVDAKGNAVVGENRIEKIMDGVVIQEHFSDTSSGFFGGSLSVFSPADSLWHQAWADNSGGFIDLIGIVDDDIRIFQTEPVVSGTKTIIRRMIFYNITEQDFTWDWEFSEDGGKSWALAWQINYVRKK